jgi:predicted dehydrogenase
MAGGKIRVGIVGASASRGFASIAHIPALRALPQFEITAVCTASQQSAEASARHYGVPLAFSEPAKLAQHPDVDLVTVSVKVPDHYQPVMAAIEAGKHVCEWPLGRNTDEARTMLDAAESRGIRHAVGLQGQMSPAINYARDLVAEGYVGRVLTATTIGCAPNWGKTIDRAYQADVANGANLMTITGGHQIDALCYCLGEFRELSAFAIKQRGRIPLERTGELVPLTAPEQLAVTGIVGDGGRSFPFRSGEVWLGVRSSCSRSMARRAISFSRRRQEAQCSARSYRCTAHKAKTLSCNRCQFRQHIALCHNTFRRTHPTTWLSSTRSWTRASTRIHRRVLVLTPQFAVTS